MKNNCKTLYFDIETTPLLGYTFGTYQVNVLDVKQDTELLCFAYQFDDEPIKVHSRRKNTERKLAKKLWKLFNEADVIIGHNGDKFDIKMSNMFFLRYGLAPPSPYKSVDTLKLARRYFKFTQNKLDYLGKIMFDERKNHTSMQLWFDCMAGDKKALKTMEDYNVQDVVLLKKVHLNLRGWHTGGPNYNVYNGTTHQCPACGSDTQKRGTYPTAVRVYQRYQCKNHACAKWTKLELIKGKPVIR